MKKLFTLLFLFPFLLLPGKEKWEIPARVSLLYKEVPGKLFSRVRPAPDIRLTIREAREPELLHLQKSHRQLSGPTLFLVPEKFLPSPLPPGAAAYPYALTGKILALAPSAPCKDIPLKSAINILEGKEAYWEKIPGRSHSGRLALYGAKTILPPPLPGKKGPLLISTDTSRRAGKLLALDPGGMGIFPLTFWEEKNLTLLSIEKIPPTPENFMNGKYPFTKKLFLYLPPAAGREKKVLRQLKALLTSRPFQIELLHAGVLPLPPAENE